MPQVLMDALGARFAEVMPDCSDAQLAAGLRAYGVTRCVAHACARARVGGAGRRRMEGGLWGDEVINPWGGVATGAARGPARRGGGRRTGVVCAGAL